MTKQGGRSHSESRRRWGIREWQSHSTRRGGSQLPWDKSPHDLSSPWDWKLPTPPWPSWDKVVKGVDTPEAEAQQMAFRDTMEIGHSSSMSLEDQVQEEEQQRWGGSIAEGSLESDTTPPGLEEGNASDVSMVNDSLLQHDLDMVVKEEREENMDTGAPASSMAPMPLRETPMWESFEARDTANHCSQTSEESMDQNPPMTQISMRMSYWGQSLTSLLPGDIQMTPSPLSFPWGRMTCNLLKGSTCRAV